MDFCRERCIAFAISDHMRPGESQVLAILEVELVALKADRFLIILRGHTFPDTSWATNNGRGAQ